MKAEEKRLAIRLRQQGKSYNEIASVVDVSKGTLSAWLKDLELSEDQRQKLRSRFGDHGGVGAKAHKEKWIQRRNEVMERYDPPFGDPEFMLGLGLYWGEGSKYSESETAFTNADPNMIRQFKNWVCRYFRDDFDRFSVSVHHYGIKPDEEVKSYWSVLLEIPLADFVKSQTAISGLSKLKKGNTLPFGTAQVRLRGKGKWVVRVKIQKALAHWCNGSTADFRSVDGGFNSPMGH